METRTSEVKVSTGTGYTIKPRDYDAENRGKTRCQLVAASMPYILEHPIMDYEQYKNKIDMLVEYIFTGK